MKFIAHEQRSVSSDGRITFKGPRLQPTGQPNEAIAEFSIDIDDLKSSFTCNSISTVTSESSSLSLFISTSSELQQALMHQAHWGKETTIEQFLTEFSEGLVTTFVEDPYRVRTARYSVAIANSLVGKADDHGFRNIISVTVGPSDPSLIEDDE